LYRVIDWIMRLPKSLDARVRNGVLQLERRSTMPYLSSIERIGMEIGHEKGLQKGRQEGRQEGGAELLAMQLTKRFGVLDAEVCARLAAADVEQLSAWAANFVDATTLDEVFHRS
jgi:predicted transposase YdaD